MKTLLRASIIFIMALLSSSLSAKSNEAAHTIILDPGHGGRDYGAVGKITNEKTINLNVALEIRKLLKDYEQIKIVMTRKDDRFIALQERADIANRNHGDLFISIHVNSLAKSNKNRRNIAGASVYTLGLHRTASNLEVAKRENSVMELEADYTTKYQGFDPNSTESYIMFELSQNKHLDRSINFADLTVMQLTKTAGRRNRGVLQAGFWVLHASAVPSVLIELDFICNPTSEKFMNSKDGVKKMARSIADAILRYFGYDRKAVEEVEKRIEPEQADESEVRADIITYRVQILATDRSLPSKSSEFKGLNNIDEYEQDGMYKYTTGGDFATEEAAEAYAAKSVRGKFPQAFVIKWKNGHRIN